MKTKKNYSKNSVLLTPKTTTTRTKVPKKLRKMLRDSNKKKNKKSEKKHKRERLQLPSNLNFSHEITKRKSLSLPIKDFRLKISTPRNNPLNRSFDQTHIRSASKNSLNRYQRLPQINPISITGLNSRKNKTELRKKLIKEKEILEKKLNNIGKDDGLGLSEFSLSDTDREMDEVDKNLIDALKYDQMRREIERFGVRELGKFYC